MDLVLNFCDDYFFDKMWAALVPASAFLPGGGAPSLSSANGTSMAPLLAHGAFAKWAHVVSYLPHPPTPYTLTSTQTPVSAWPRDYLPRQALSLSLATFVGIHLMYFTFATFSYYFIFDHKMMRHPRFLKNQVRLEIETSVRAFPGMILLFMPFFIAEVRGHSKLYHNVDEYGWPWFFASIAL